MNLYLSRGDLLRFPAPTNDIRADIIQKSIESARIIATDSPVRNLAKYIQCADLSNEEHLRTLNAIAQRTDTMTETEANIFSGALDAESVNGLGDVFRIAQSLEQYEIIPEVTSDRELGGWLVENNLLGVSFPEAVHPYLDYVAIGAEYYANHGGAYTLNGYVKRKEAVPELADESSLIRLTLATDKSTITLGLPASDERLEYAKSVLGVVNFAHADILTVDTPSPCLTEVLLHDRFTVEDVDELAMCLLDIEQNGDMNKFHAALAVEQPSSFPHALDIATCIDDYDLIPDDMEEYGKEVLRRIGANESVIDTINVHMDFAALGKDFLVEDGVRQTDFGMIRRRSEPFPPEQQAGMTMT